MSGRDPLISIVHTASAVVRACYVACIACLLVCVWPTSPERAPRVPLSPEGALLREAGRVPHQVLTIEDDRHLAGGMNHHAGTPAEAADTRSVGLAEKSGRALFLERPFR